MVSTLWTNWFAVHMRSSGSLSDGHLDLWVWNSEESLAGEGFGDNLSNFFFFKEESLD